MRPKENPGWSVLLYSELIGKNGFIVNDSVLIIESIRFTNKESRVVKVWMRGWLTEKYLIIKRNFLGKLT